MRRIRILFTLFVALTMSNTTVDAARDFHDVGSDFWAKAEIDFLSSQSIIGGYKDDSFRPGNDLTRAQAAIMIARALDLDLTNRPDPLFSDIGEGFHAYDVVAAVADDGIITGRDGRFMPNEKLTRGQMAAILQRAFDLQGKWEQDFSDIGRSHTFYNEIQALAANQITTGHSDNTFRAYHSTTRAQYSVFLARALDERFKPDATPVLSQIDQFETKVVELTNVERRKHGLRELQADTELAKVARVKSQDMRENNYFAHESPTYGSPFDMMREFGITYRAAAENIAMGYRAPEQVVEGWMNSPGHRANILNGDLTHIGVGYDSDGHYWTQMFIRK
ncbi:hypothetical protein JCM9140_2536 [Halalkalibacter wakoensis JCM 9140]|uniref:SLH domain-containing protein n=1 Tax=Halalkalibacter wakoensis JCM 9140 TaxID=1236970 RepID=W4Q3C1_9BACI|nr:S-layer homology domain-containing protein [Halalkalibacter wakoensis]GAE26467.1 hypothetical protein JCM9140_2536 [Halalkalibacter wakoensis JCM 9140]